MTELKGKIREDRIAWFENWKSSIDMRIRILNDKVQGLDYSIDSLNKLEYFILKTFQNPNESLSLENLELKDSLGTYIGECFIRNTPIDIKWTVSLDPRNEYKELFNFICYVKGTDGYTGFNPYLNLVPNLIKEGTGDKLITSFNLKLNSIANKQNKSNEDSEESELSNISYNHFLMFKNDQVKLGMVGDVIKAYCIKKDKVFDLQEKNRNQLLLIFDQSYQFYFYFDNRAEVLTENKEIILN